MIDDEGRHEGPVLADAASKFLRQRPGKGDAVAFDHQIDVVELHGGAAEHDVADKTAHGIDADLQAVTEFPGPVEHVQHGLREPGGQQFRQIPFACAGVDRDGHAGRILDEHVDEVGAGDHADDLVLFDDGNQPLVRAHDDLHEALERGVRRDRQDGALHVFGNRHVAQFMGYSLGSRLAFHIADAMARPRPEDGSGLEAVAVHELFRFPDGLPVLNADGGRGHEIPRLLVRVYLHVQLLEDGVLEFGDGDALDRSGRRETVPPAPERLADLADVHGVHAAAGHDLYLFLHVGEGEQDVAGFHLHEFLGEVGEIAHEAVQRGFGEDHAVRADFVRGGGVEQFVENLDVDAGHARLDEISDEGQIHAVLAQPCPREEIFRLGGRVGERARVAVDAEPEKSGFLTGRGDAPFLQGLADKRAGGARGPDVRHVGIDDLVLFAGVGGGVVIPYLHLHAGKIEQILHLRHAGTDLRVHDDDALHAGVIDLFYIFKGIQKYGGFVEELVQRLFHAARKDHDAVGVDHGHADHRRQGIPVGVAVAGDDGGGGGQGRFHAVSLCSLRQVVFGRGGVIRAGLGVLGPGMVFPVDLEQAFGLDVRIELRGAHVRMAEEDLHGTEIRPAFQQVGGEGVPERVRGNGFSDARLQRVAFDQLPDALPGEAVAGAVEEHPVLNGGEEGAHDFEVFGHAHDRRVMQGDKALLASLAENAHDAPLEIQIDGLQFDELGNAHTRGVQQLQHGPIPEPELAGGVRRVEQPDDLILRQHVGQEGREFGRVDEGGRVGGQFPPFDAPCEETAQGRNAPRERAGRVAAFAQPSDEQRDVFVV